MINFDAYDIGNHRLSCPACGRGPRDKTMGLTIDHDGAGVCHCFRCGFVENYRPERGVHLTAPSKPRIKAATSTAKHETLAAAFRDQYARARETVAKSRIFPRIYARISKRQKPCVTRRNA